MSTRVFPLADSGGCDNPSSGLLSSLSALLPSRSRSPEEESSAAANNNSAQPSSPSDETKHMCSRFLKKRSPDIYGQRHAIESSKCISDSLRLLERELWSLPEEKKSGIEQARVLCPEIFEAKEHRMLFLRCEQFNVDVSSCKWYDHNYRLDFFHLLNLPATTLLASSTENGKLLDKTD